MRWFALPLIAIVVTACTTVDQGYNPLDEYDLVEPKNLGRVDVEAVDYPPAVVERGRYLAELLACGTCHTDGALVGQPNPDRAYGGSGVGIAWSNPFVQKRPGIVYPPNITPDPVTGIGAWSDEEIARVIRSGIDNHGKRAISVMPWPGYSHLTDDDTEALVAFLRSLEPVRHDVPSAVEPGDPHRAPYVHFGVYQSRPMR